MSTQTMKHDRQRRIRRQQEMMAAQKAAELGGHLRAAAKLLYGKSKTPLDVLMLSKAEQVELLTEYVYRLEAEAQDFLESWPDEDGRRAVRWFRMERSKVLAQIAKLKIGIAKSDEPAREMK
jgi:hypothetical protein